MAIPALGALAASALVPLLKEWAFKMFVALGVSFVSYKVSGEALQRLLDHVSANYFALDGDLLGLLGLAGVPEAFNIIFGAFNFCIGLFTTGKALKFFAGGGK
ncbi:DUF2523 family protein [Neisseria iguanae]|nr:DUF2523 family protein [Neisseria iguanae]